MESRTKSKRRITEALTDRKVFAILLVLTLVFFWRTVLNPTELLNEGDIANFAASFNYFNHDSFAKTGELALWNPYWSSGLPFISNILGGRYYPTNLLFLIDYNDWYMNFDFILHTLIAGIFTYLFARKLKLAEFPSLVSAIVFMFSGTLLQRIGGDPALFIGMSLIPFVFYSFERMMNERRTDNAALFAIAVAMQFLSGHAQYVFYTMIAVLAYYVFKIFFAEEAKEDKIKELKKTAPLVIFAAILAVCLSAIQLIPTLEFTQYISGRGTESTFEFASQGSLPIQQVITAFVPYFFGNRLNNTSWGYPHGELYFYAGILGIFLAVYGAIKARSKTAKFFAILTVFAILFAMGKNTPLFWLFYKFVPGSAYFSVPMRMLSVYCLAVAVLAGFGISELEKATETEMKKLSKKFLVLSGLGIAGLLGALIFREKIIAFGNEMLKTVYAQYSGAPFVTSHSFSYFASLITVVYEMMIKHISFLTALLFLISMLFYLKSKRQITGRDLKIAIVALLLMDLWFFGMQYADNKMLMQRMFPGFNGTKEVFGNTEAIGFLAGKAQTELFRVHARVANSQALPQRVTVRNGIQITSYYDSMQLDYYNKVMQPLFSDYNQKNAPKLLGMMNVKYLAAEKREELNNTDYEFIMETKDAKVYENTKFLPRAYLVRKTKVAAGENAYAEITNDNFEPSQEAIVEKEVATGMNGGKETDAIKIENYAPNRITISADVASPALLVLSEIWYPGWKVFVDGKEKELLRTDYLLRGVVIETAGIHKTEFRYEPESFRWGMLISIAALIAILVIFVLQRKNSK